jgi:hypothetical protein
MKVENKLIEFLTMQVEALQKQNEKLQQILKEQTDYICENRL